MEEKKKREGRGERKKEKQNRTKQMSAMDS